MLDAESLSFTYRQIAGAAIYLTEGGREIITALIGTLPSIQYINIQSAHFIAGSWSKPCCRLMITTFEVSSFSLFCRYQQLSDKRHYKLPSMDASVCWCGRKIGSCSIILSSANAPSHVAPSPEPRFRAWNIRKLYYFLYSWLSWVLLNSASVLQHFLSNQCTIF